jgi:uncharacterized protein YkwD
MRWSCVVLLAVVGCGPIAPSSTPSPAASDPPGGGPPGATPPADDGGDPGETTGDPDRRAEPSPAGAGGDPLGADEQALLDLHNDARAAHCAPPLSWSPQLAKVAQGWADSLAGAGCAFEHSRTRFGENLAMGTSGALGAETIVEMWYREVDKYDFKRGRFGMDTGHFTQLVWRGTTKLGCGRAPCNGWDIVVCNYDPPGNVETQFVDNVRPSGCKK